MSRYVDLDKIEFLKVDGNDEFNHGVDCCINRLRKAEFKPCEGAIKIYTDDEFNDIGFLCRRWREDKKISVQRIADLCDCTRQNVTAFERGEVKSIKVFLSYVAAGFCLLGWQRNTLLACNTNEILEILEEVIDNENKNNK